MSIPPPYAARPPVSSLLPPLIFGTATLNYQFNSDPYALHPTSLVRSALLHGLRAFDTSPYYGPAEEILGAALSTAIPSLATGTSTQPPVKIDRSDYFILTKCGRIRGDEFDYSPEWIRHSVKRSLLRLRTSYLDVVYLHDVEFVSANEVLEAVRALRAIRDTEGTIRYVGICGFPVSVLAELAEMVLTMTGEPVDIVQSYGNYTVQNQQMKQIGLRRFKDAGVGVVTNASPLGMGLLRSVGVPTGITGGKWHPAPKELRVVCGEASKVCEQRFGIKLEGLCLRWALQMWLYVGSGVGTQSMVNRPTNARELSGPMSDTKIGVSVIGVSRLEELDETMAIWKRLCAGDIASQVEGHQVEQRATVLRDEVFGKKWCDYAWESGGPGFVNARKTSGVSEKDAAEFEEEKRVIRSGVDMLGVSEQASEGHGPGK